MSEITILDNEFITMKYYPDKKILHHTFHKYIFGDEFRAALNKGVEVLQQYNAHKWLSDDRENSALPKEDTNWSVTDWFPRVVKAGWKYWAIVLPKKIVGQMNMNQFIEEYSKKGVITKIFSDPTDAMTWLEKQ
jgi:hypothetical protein